MFAEENMKYIIKSVCPICSQEKVVFTQPREQTCSVCKETFMAEESCENHAICYNCEQRFIRDSVITYCLKSNEVSPIALQTQLMQLPGVPMHGPVHHLLLPAALLTAYCNCNLNNSIELATALKIADQRSQDVPGAACAYWGACGAAIGCGIFVSIIKEVGPLSTDTWKEVGELTAKNIETISSLGGPRCCKRDAYLSLLETIEFCNKELSTNFSTESPTCIFFVNNKQCKGKACPFFPKLNK